jgi:predicted RNA binding protein YcfA (HicA-like mRNA interferase family)
MPELPVISGRQASEAFQRDGWTLDRQVGSHMIHKKAGVRLSLSVPDHKVLDRGLLRRLIRDAGLTVKRFRSLLQ